MSLIGLAISGIVAAASNVGKQVKKNKELNKNLVTMENCGKRPFWTGKRRKAWDECVALTSTIMPGNNGGGGGGGTNFAPGETAEEQGNETFFQKYQIPIIVGGAITAGVLIYKQMKK